VKLLGTYGEDMEAAVHARDDDRKTALEYAARDGHVEIMSKYLLLEGANPNSFNYRVHSGATPLHYAANAGNLELVQLLLASGADPDSGLFHVANINVAEVLLAAGADPNAKDHNSANVLAHKLEDIELLRFFLERGVNLNNEDYLGNTPLHLA
ncbi:ankyrin repeat-containing domain protein, partial [Mycena galopus ATCC 62051]